MRSDDETDVKKNKKLDQKKFRLQKSFNTPHVKSAAGCTTSINNVVDSAIALLKSKKKLSSMNWSKLKYSKYNPPFIG